LVRLATFRRASGTDRFSSLPTGTSCRSWPALHIAGSRIGRRTIIAMLLIVALLIVWQVFGAAWG